MPFVASKPGKECLKPRGDLFFKLRCFEDRIMSCRAIMCHFVFSMFTIKAFPILGDHFDYYGFFLNNPIESQKLEMISQP